MKNKRLNTSLWRRRGMQALTLLLACALLTGLAITASARGDWQGEIVDPVTPKPVVTIQGNLVTEKGKPTGFYELALCVRSGRTITDPTGVTGVTPGDVVSEADYAAYLALHPEIAEDPSAIFNFQYFPFNTATATMHVNTDILTAVNWNLKSVTYESFDALTGTYPSDAAVAPGAVNYPRGIDTDPAVQGYDPAVLSQADAFPDITTPDLNDLSDATRSVALDVENDPRMSTAEGVAEHFENNDALITLSASAPDNYPVVLEQSTPLVVARFSYDLKRFDTTKVSAALGGVDAQRNSITGAPGAGEEGLWMGWDKTSLAGSANFGSKQPLTWLGESTGTFDFTDSDELAAATQADQTVWVHTATLDPAAPDTFFYYYLAAETDPAAKTGTVKIYDKTTGATQEVKDVALPNTAGFKILTQGTDRNPGTPAADYTYFRNLLSLNEGTVVVKLVNEPTFKKPTGAGGKTILFYDWDNRLIGSMTVDGGDVRAEVEAYVEENMVHPDLRPGSAFMDDGAGNTDLNKLSSLERQYTYRGKYAYTVGGDDATQGAADGKEYPLTNKLDYVFTKRVNTVLTQEESGATVQYVHPYALNDPALDPNVRDNDAAEYPYAYGWAVIEDTSAFNGNKSATPTASDPKGPWKVMHDADMLRGDKDVWTTMGVGELSDMKRPNMNNAMLPTVTTVDPLAVRTAPVFLKDSDPAWTDGTLGNNYAYTLSGENSYLRFADFSDVTAEFDRYEGKDTLIVKAVYEEGESLMDGSNYTLAADPAYTKWNSKADDAGGAYKTQITMERAGDNGGIVQGTSRIRMPVIRQDNTIDYKWIADADKGVNNDLDNVDLVTARGLTQTTYSKVDYDTGELVTFSLALSARHNRVDYMLLEQYGYNFITGTQRSASNSDLFYNGDPRFIVDNYNYLLSDSDTLDDLYDCDFATKEGSRGFVLYCTLGHFMEQATKFNHGKIDSLSYNNSVAFRIVQDANLRMDFAGRQPAAKDSTTIQDAFIAAQFACEAHKNDPAYDCWDPNLDCAKLTYHQAQWFLIDYQANAGADILPVATADAQKLPFCQYHISCSGGHVPVAPTTWKELTDTLRTYNDAAAGSDDQNNAKADLEALDLATLENLTSLRSNANGRKYNNLATFINALLTADAQVKAAGLDASWPNLQYVILNGAPTVDAAAIREEAQKNYWWYNGAASAPKVNNFEDLLKAAETIRTPVKLKDGDATFLPESALTAATFPENSEEYLTADSPTRRQRNAWVALTDNLVPGHAETLHDPDGTPNSGDETVEYTYDRFSDMETFLDLFTDAYNAILSAADAAGDEPPADSDAWWKAIQTKLLRDKDPADNLGDHDGTGDNEFWWRGGQTPFRVMNLSTLVECVRRLNGPSGDDRTAAQAEWDRLKVADIEGVAISQSLRWKGSDAAHPMYPNTGEDLVAGNEDFQKVTILNQLKSAVSRFDAAKAADAGVMLNWNNIQYLLLHDKDPLPSNDVVYDQSTYYWWKDGNTTGNKVNLSTTNTADANLTELIRASYRSEFNDPGVASSILAATKGADNSFWAFTKLISVKVQGTTFPRADAAVDPNANDTYDGPDVLTDVKAAAYPGATSADVDAFMTVLTEFRDKAKAALGVTDPYGVPNLVWAQVQYSALNGGTYLPVSDQVIKDLRDKDKALAGDYWWYYADQRVPPDPPAPPPANEPSDDFRDGPLLTAVKGGAALNMTKADVQAMGMTANAADSKWPTDKNMNKIWAFLVADLQAQADPETATKNLTWVQIQYYFATSYKASSLGKKPGTLTDSASALAGLISLGYDQSKFPAGVKTTFSLRPAEVASLEDLGELVLVEPEVPKAEEPNGADTEMAAPKTTTTTEALPEGGAVVTTVITGTDGYVTTVTTRITPGGVAETVTTITAPTAGDLAPSPPEGGVKGDVPGASTEGTLISQPSADSFPLPGGSLKDPAPGGPALDLGEDTPAPDPDMATAVPETPEGEDAAAAWNGGYVAKATQVAARVTPGGVAKRAALIQGHHLKPAYAGVIPRKGGQDLGGTPLAIPPDWRKSWWLAA